MEDIVKAFQMICDELKVEPLSGDFVLGGRLSYEFIPPTTLFLHSFLLCLNKYWGMENTRLFLFFSGIPETRVQASKITLDLFSKIADSTLNLSFEGATLAVLTLQKSLRYVMQISFHAIIKCTKVPQ